MTDENTPSSAVDLSGRIALVTGASRGIGAAVAASDGWFTVSGTAAIDSLLVTSLCFWAIEFVLQKMPKP